jgi:hypothetical protein
MHFAGPRLDRVTYMQFLTKKDPHDWPEDEWVRGSSSGMWEDGEARNVHLF